MFRPRYRREAARSRDGPGDSVLQMTVSFEPLRRILDGLVHGSAADDACAADRHRRFIAVHLAAGFVALMAFPAWLAIAGLPSPPLAIAFAFLVAPLLIAAFLSRTGRLQAAHVMSAAALTGLAAWLATFTGGIASPVIVWLAVTPIATMLAGERRVTLLALGLAGLALVLLTLLGMASLLPSPLAMPPLTAPALLGGAILYAGMIAVRITALQADAMAAARRGDSRYRFLADHARDLITRHRVNGDVAFASPAARALFDCAPSELEGPGFVRRVHIGDRPAVLRALSEADRTDGEAVAAFRLRTGPGEGGPFVWAEMHCRPVREAEGGRVIVAVTRDITLSKAPEDTVTAFTEPGGTVTVAARQVDSAIVIEIADSGIGIAADALRRLGTPFVQRGGDIGRCHGAGLGLSVGKGLVQLHGGVLDIASRPGEGTRVRVTLPIGPGEPISATPRPRSASGSATIMGERRIA